MVQLISPWALLGGAVLGLISVTTVLIYDHYAQERRRRALTQHISNLNEDIQLLRRDVHVLRKNKETKLAPERTNSSLSFFSESSDEFYDAVDDFDYEQEIELIDDAMKNGNWNEALDLLECINPMRSDNVEVLWRYAKVKQRLSKCEGIMKEREMELLAEGIEACERALCLNDECVNTHKWYAILIGARSMKRNSLKEKINDSLIFRRHLEIAIRLQPKDEFLHYLMGRYMSEIASLTWYERAGAVALNGGTSLPTCTYGDALEEFQLALDYGGDYTEIYLSMAKCHLSLGSKAKAFTLLNQCREKKATEKETEVELNELLSKHSIITKNE